MSNEGVQNHLKNGGAHSNPHETSGLLTNVDIPHENIGEGAFLHDSVVGGTSPNIQDGGTRADIVRESSFEDFINFDTEHLGSPNDIVDVENFTASIVDTSAEWLKNDGVAVDASAIVNKMTFTTESSDSVGLELETDKSVTRDLGDFFSSDIAFSLSESLSLPCSINLTKLSNGICHSSPVSPTNFLEETPISRSRSYSDTENDDKNQTKAFLEELERGSQLTAEDKELMETSRKELQAYEFQVLAQDKSNTLLTPQELENLPVHGLEFEEAPGSTESPCSILKADTTKSEMKADQALSKIDFPPQSDLSSLVTTSLSFLSVPDSSLSTSGRQSDASLQVVDQLWQAHAIDNHSNMTKSTSKTVAHANSSSKDGQLTNNVVNVMEIKPLTSFTSNTTTRQHIGQIIKTENTSEINVRESTIVTKPQNFDNSNVAQLVYTDTNGQEQLLQLGATPNTAPTQVQVPGANISDLLQASVNNSSVSGSTAATIAMANNGGNNVYLTAVPMLYFKDGCFVIPVQQVPVSNITTTSTMSNAETYATAAAFAADTADAGAVDKAVHSIEPTPASTTTHTSPTILHQKRRTSTASVSNTRPLKRSSSSNSSKVRTTGGSKIPVSEEKKWLCNICNQGFPRLYKLKLHFMKHTGEKPYQCSQPGCKWAFTTAFKLKRHEESHLGKKDYICDIHSCGKKFTTVYNLNTHKKSHSRLCTVECPTCSEKFSTQRQLDYHMRAQGHGQKELAYTCPHEGCGRKFFSRYCMGSHMRVHSHTEKVHCPIEGCQRIFDKQCRLQQHLRSHTGEKPFLCTGQDCGAAFATASKLKRHARKHTGERRWVCDIEGCGKAFLRAEHLRAHQITHTGEKPFECNIPQCNARFKCKSSLYVHLKRHQQNAGKDGQTNGHGGKSQRSTKYSNKAALNQKNNYNRQLQNALGDLFTLINAEDLESLINSQVETLQQNNEVVTSAPIETFLSNTTPQTINPADILSVDQGGLQTILNIAPTGTTSHVINPTTDILHQGATFTTNISLLQDKGKSKSVINITPGGNRTAAGSAKREGVNNRVKKRKQLIDNTSLPLGVNSGVKIEANSADFPDSTTLSIQEDQVNSLVNPNDVMTSQAITFRDPETGAIYVQTQLLQDDPPNPDIYNEDVICLDGVEHPELGDFPYIFNDPGQLDLVDNPGVLEFTGTTINLQDLED